MEDLNLRRLDLQSNALPTELTRQDGRQFKVMLSTEEFKCSSKFLTRSSSYLYKYAEHPIRTPSLCGISIVYLPVIFEPLTVAYYAYLFIGGDRHKSVPINLLVGGDGVEPPEANANRFTVCPAPTYGITTHIKSNF